MRAIQVVEGLGKANADSVIRPYRGREKRNLKGCAGIQRKRTSRSESERASDSQMFTEPLPLPCAGGRPPRNPSHVECVPTGRAVRAEHASRPRDTGRAPWRPGRLAGPLGQGPRPRLRQTPFRLKEREHVSRPSRHGRKRRGACGAFRPRSVQALRRPRARGVQYVLTRHARGTHARTHARTNTDACKTCIHIRTSGTTSDLSCIVRSLAPPLAFFYSAPFDIFISCATQIFQDNRYLVSLYLQYSIFTNFAANRKFMLY